METDIFQDIYDPEEEFDDEYLEMLAQFVEKKREDCFKDYTPGESDKIHCPRTFDVLSCWSETPAGYTAYTRCPAIIPGFDPRRKAFKECTENGTWARHHLTGNEWGNYTTCVDLEAGENAEFLNRIYVTGYAISACALIIGLIIFCSYRSLHCTRVTIHKNLFLSFLIADIMWIVLYKEVIEKPKVMLLNMVWCQVWYVLIQYFYIANHQWMFCEGLYLHSVLSLTFINDRRLLSWFYVIGWILPIPILIIYVLLRIFYEKSAYECWVHENNQSLSYYVLSTPLVVSLIANLCFLFNIIRLLLTKLKRMPGGHQHCEHKRGSLASDQGNRGSKETMMQIPTKESGKLNDRMSIKRSVSTLEQKEDGNFEFPGKDDRKQSGATETTEIFVENGGGKSQSVLRRGTAHSDKSTLFPQEHTCPCIYKKAVRATMFLVPLLGLHFLLSPFSEQEPQIPIFVSDEEAEGIIKQLEGLKTERPFYDTLLAITASFQVMALFRRKFERRRITKENTRAPTVKILRPPTDIFTSRKNAVAVETTEKL